MKLTIDDFILKILNNNQENYKDRFICEYYQLLVRINKLHNLITKAKDNMLSFSLNCPVEMLEKQLTVMLEYLAILQKRAEIENINIEKELAQIKQIYLSEEEKEEKIEEGQE